MGSSYLFRIDESNVVDATSAGYLARFMNHSCEVGGSYYCPHMDHGCVLS